MTRPVRMSARRTRLYAGGGDGRSCVIGRRDLYIATRALALTPRYGHQGIDLDQRGPADAEPFYQADRETEMRTAQAYFEARLNSAKWTPVPRTAIDLVRSTVL